MNAPDTIDFALGLLEGDAADRAALEVESDPALAARLERIGRSLRALLDEDSPAYEPPDGLRSRTLAFVERETRRRPAVLEFTPTTRRRFGIEDFAVAATIFLASLLALTPAILRGRERWGRAACADTLQKVGMRLNQYAAMNNSYPFVSADDPVPHVGAMVCRLNESGLNVEPKDFKCPCSDSDCGKRGRMPDLPTVEAMFKHSPEAARHTLDLDYAFNVGYRGPQGKPGPLPAHPLLHTVPLLADRPRSADSGEILEGNSPNHGGRGQNVYFADGHVSWHNDRRISAHDADIYLNNHNIPCYGLDLGDSVLLPGSHRVENR